MKYFIATVAGEGETTSYPIMAKTKAHALEKIYRIHKPLLFFMEVTEKEGAAFFRGEIDV